MAQSNQQLGHNRTRQVQSRKTQARYESVDHSAELMAKRRQLLANHRAKRAAQRGAAVEAILDDSARETPADQA